jgi:hypothetical protein
MKIFRKRILCEEVVAIESLDYCYVPVGPPDPPTFALEIVLRNQTIKMEYKSREKRDLAYNMLDTMLRLYDGEEWMLTLPEEDR